MADYLFLYSEGSMPETEAEQAKVMKAWTDWFTKLGAALKDGGNPFSGVAKSVGPDGSISDGPVGSSASGYSVVVADSIDDAVEMAKSCPVILGGASISVFETFNVM